MTAFKQFVNMGGKVTRQVGNHIFGLDGYGGNYEVLAFEASTGDLVKAKHITDSEQAKVKTVDDLHDLVFGKPEAPDFTKVVA